MQQIEIKISNNEINYDEALMFMESRVEDISNNKSKELLWFLNHNHIYTQGTSASKDEVLNTTVIDIIKSNRGGKTTYHGPGQRIVYFMLNLNNKNKDIRKFITVIENSVISFLADYNIEAQAFKDRYQNTSMEELGIKLDQSEFDSKFKKIFLEKLKTI